MGETADGATAETEYICPVHDQELLGVRAIVHPDGSDAKVTLHTTKGSVTLIIPFEQISAALAEMQHASQLMLYRQTTPGAFSGNPIKKLLHSALTPSKVSVVIDPPTGDRLFIHQFAERMPIVTRMSPESVNRTLTDLTRTAKNAAN